MKIDIEFISHNMQDKPIFTMKTLIGNSPCRVQILWVFLELLQLGLS